MPLATGNLNVMGEVLMMGTLRIDVGGPSSDQLTAASIRLSVSSALVVHAHGPLDVQRSERRYPVVSAPIELQEASDRETFATVRGVDRGAADHAGYGVFLRDTIYDDAQASIELLLYQAGAGDADGDGHFASSDLIQILVAGKYELDSPTTWTEGDWTGDSRFTTSDLVWALQQGTYESGPLAQSAVLTSRHVSALHRPHLLSAAASLEWPDERRRVVRLP
jgi:hypothetical protein